MKSALFFSLFSFLCFLSLSEGQMDSVLHLSLLLMGAGCMHWGLNLALERQPRHAVILFFKHDEKQMLLQSLAYQVSPS